MRKEKRRGGNENEVVCKKLLQNNPQMHDNQSQAKGIKNESFQKQSTSKRFEANNKIQSKTLNPTPPRSKSDKMRKVLKGRGWGAGEGKEGEGNEQKGKTKDSRHAETLREKKAERTNERDSQLMQFLKELDTCRRAGKQRCKGVRKRRMKQRCVEDYGAGQYGTKHTTGKMVHCLKVFVLLGLILTSSLCVQLGLRSILRIPGVEGAKG